MRSAKIHSSSLQQIFRCLVLRALRGMCLVSRCRVVRGGRGLEIAVERWLWSFVSPKPDRALSYDEARVALATTACTHLLTMHRSHMGFIEALEATNGCGNTIARHVKVLQDLSAIRVMVSAFRLSRHCVAIFGDHHHPKRNTMGNDFYRLMT